MDDSKNQAKAKKENVWRETVDKIARVFPYFLLAYFVLTAVNLLFSPLDEVINFNYFTIVIIGLMIISVRNHSFKSDNIYARGKKTLSWLFAHSYRAVLIAVFTISCAYLGADFWEVIIACLGGSSVLFGWDSRWSAILTLIFLSFCPVFLLFDRAGAAEQLAVYAYFFLVIAVMSQLIEVNFKGKSYPQLML